VTSAISAFKRR